MEQQQSYKDNKPTLYLVPTPIGNLSDMTYRAVDTLKAVDVIFAEDTRHSGTLLKHYAIDTPMKSYHKHNERMRNELIVSNLKEGKNLALISDAGMPLISDPGETLVQSVIQAGFHVVSLPGPSAFLTALVASGIQAQPSLFYGFLPTKPNERKKQLKQLKTFPYTLVFYEAPHRIKDTLNALYDIFNNRSVTIAREISKQYETYIRTTLDAIDTIPELKGEIVVIVEGFNETDPLSEDDVIDHIELLIQDDLSEMQAIKQVAKQRNMKKNDVYMAYQTHKKHFKGKE